MNENEYYSENTVKNRKASTIIKLVIALFILFAVFPVFSMLALAVWGIWDAERLQHINCTYKVEAVVIEYTDDCPVYSFGYGAEEYKVRGAYKYPIYETGERVKIYINPDNPLEFYDNAIMRLQNNPFLQLFLVAGVIVVVDIAVIFILIKKNKSGGENKTYTDDIL